MTVKRNPDFSDARASDAAVRLIAERDSLIKATTEAAVETINGKLKSQTIKILMAILGAVAVQLCTILYFAYYVGGYHEKLVEQINGNLPRETFKQWVVETEHNPRNNGWQGASLATQKQ